MKSNPSSAKGASNTLLAEASLAHSTRRPRLTSAAYYRSDKCRFGHREIAAARNNESLAARL